MKEKKGYVKVKAYIYEENVPLYNELHSKRLFCKFLNACMPNAYRFLQAQELKEKR